MQRRLRVWPSCRRAIRAARIQAAARGAGFARHQRGAQGGIATTDDEYIGVKGFSFHDGLPRAVPAAVQRGNVLCHFRCRSAVDRVRLS
jgi:hypothetical protein